jgi:PadR family transcriptional regulator PadR
MPTRVQTLGEFEIIVLLAVLRLGEATTLAYGSTIRDEIQRHANRRIARGAIYVTLDRLEEKGLLASRLSEGTPARDQRPKRLFKVTPGGRRSLVQALELMNRLQQGLTLSPVRR